MYDPMMAERRLYDRDQVDEIAFVTGDGSSIRCRLLNISEDGAAIEVPDAAYIRARFCLMTDKDRKVRNCRIVWISQNRIGLQFIDRAE